MNDTSRHMRTGWIALSATFALLSCAQNGQNEQRTMTKQEVPATDAGAMTGTDIKRWGPDASGAWKRSSAN